MNDKISNKVQAVLNDVDGITYVRLHCWLNDPQLTDEHRQQLADEMSCTHLMQTSNVCEIKVPRRFVETIATWKEVKAIKRITVF